MKFLLLLLFFVFPLHASTLEEDYAQLKPYQQLMVFPNTATINLLTPYAEKGNAVAAYILAAIYEEGKAVPKDENKAFELYLLSAQKNPLAQMAVANMYVSGRGTQINLEEAIHFYDMVIASNNEKIKEEAGINKTKLQQIIQTQNTLNELEKNALLSNPMAMMQMAELCLASENTVCGYIWLSLCRQNALFEQSFERIDDAIEELIPMMTMDELTTAEEEISLIQKHFNDLKTKNN